MNDTLKLLEEVKKGNISPEEALLKLKTEPYKELGFAKVDLHRNIRQGVSEIIYGESKEAEQIEGIVNAMRSAGRSDITITRLSSAKADYLAEKFPLEYFSAARIAVIDRSERALTGKIVVATGGTSDMPVAEEAAVTAELMGNRVTRLYDVGVAGLHRLLSNVEELMTARVIIAVAGMEGALASVIGGISDAPLIAVPTSVGYGANFKGLSALLSMLNSCAAGSAVVNIDNGFGAAYIASKINHMESAE